METQEIANGVMIFLFPAAIAVLWYFYKKDAKYNEKRVVALEDNVMMITKLCAKLDTMVEYHDKDIERLKDRV